MKKIAFLSFVAAVGEQFRLDAMAKGWYVGCALLYYGPEIFANAGFAAADSSFSART